jgi:YceI-like domain
MKLRTFIAGNLALLLVAASATQARGQTTTLISKPGSKMRLEGTSNIHDWQVESPFIAGSIEVGSGFPLEPGQAATPGKIEAKGNVFIQVRSLKSIEKDGKPYSDAMDGIMWDHLKVETSPKITFLLTELTLKEAAKAKESPYVFDAKGELTVAGVSKTISMPVNVMPTADKKVKISGSITVKMTDFKVEPPAPKIALGMIKTGDDVKVIFDWVVAPKPAAK